MDWGGGGGGGGNLHSFYYYPCSVTINQVYMRGAGEPVFRFFTHTHVYAHTFSLERVHALFTCV